MVKPVLAGLFPPRCRHSLWNSTPGELAAQTLCMRYSYTDRSASSSLQNQLLLGSLSPPHSPGRRCHHHNRALTRTVQGWCQRPGRSQDRRPAVVVFLLGLWRNSCSKNCRFTLNNSADTDVHCLTYYRQSQCVLCWAPAVFHYYRVAPCVLRSHLRYHQCTAEICGFHPQLWTIHNLWKKHNRRRSFFTCPKI